MPVMIGKNVAAITKHVNKLSMQDPIRARKILEHALARLPGGIDKKKEDEKAKLAIKNMRDFLHTDAIRSRGRKKAITQQVVDGIWCALSSPPPLYSTPYGDGYLMNFQKSRSRFPRTSSYEVVMKNWNATLYTRTEGCIESYEKPSLSCNDLATVMGLNKHSHSARKGRDLRAQIVRRLNPFSSIATQNQRRDNIDDEIERAIHQFGHDPTFVKQDNFSSKKYCCKDLHGNQMKHHRHNWRFAGSKEIQYDTFLKSTHFADLVANACKRCPKLFQSKEDVQKKLNFRKFSRYVPNCIKRETRASCVDPVEAPVHDYCIGLEAYCKRHYTKITSTASMTQDELSRIYGSRRPDYYVPDDSDDESVSSSMLGEDFNEENTSSSINPSLSIGDTLESKLARCNCSNCQSGKKNWLQIFGNKEERGIMRPHYYLLYRYLCPRNSHPDLTPPGHETFMMHDWKCGIGECPNCGVDLLPWKCPVFAENTDEIWVWVWQKKEGDQERTTKVKMAIKDLFVDLKKSMVLFSKHYIHTMYLNRQRYLELVNMPLIKFSAWTDFSALLDLEPPRKVNCHVNKHAVLQVFAVFFKRKVRLANGLETEIIECHIWYFFGSCEEKGKQNDWIFHNKCLDYIINFYKEKMPHCTILGIWSDNCPTQYKCRQNLFQAAKITKRHPHIETFAHQFAKQHGFKNICDTFGGLCKNHYISSQEKKHDMFADSSYTAFYFADDWIKENPPKWQKLIEEGSPKVLEKSPYEATQMFCGYLEDNEIKFKKMKEKNPDRHIAFSDRANTKENEDTDVVEHITKCYNFTHSRDDDNVTEAHFDPIPIAEDGTMFCRFCKKGYKQTAAFTKHQYSCKMAIESGKAHSLCMTNNPCYCNKCCAGQEDQCKYQEISGAMKKIWMVSLKDAAEIDREISHSILQKNRVETNTKAIDTVQKLLLKEGFTGFPNSVPPEDIVHKLPALNTGEKIPTVTKAELENIAKALCIAVQRGDGGKGVPTKVDYQRALNGNGGWSYIIRRLLTQ